jgi:hypothetical protein
MALSVGHYPAFDCGPLLGARCIALGLRSSVSDGVPFLGVQAPSVWKFVFSDPCYHATVEKAYNRVYVRQRSVLGCVLDKSCAAMFRDLGGGAPAASVIRITDVRSLYTCLHLQLDRVGARVPLGEAGVRLVQYVAECRSRLMQVALGICAHAGAVAHVGGNPFAMVAGLDVVHAAELARYPVQLEPPRCGPAVGRVSDGVAPRVNSDLPPAPPPVASSSGGRQTPARRETSSEYVHRVLRERGTGADADPYSWPDDDEHMPEHPPSYTPEQLARFTEVGVAPVPVDNSHLRTWASWGATVSAQDIAQMESGGGVSIEVLLQAVRHNDVVVPGGGFGWTRRRRASKGVKDPLVAAQMRCVNRWSKLPVSAAAEAAFDRGPDTPLDWLKPLGANSRCDALKPQHWNALHWALSHKPIADQAKLGPPRLEYLAVHGVFAAAKQCFALGGTVQGGPASASSLVSACSGWIYGLQYLWNRAALHLSKCRSDASEEVRNLPLALADRVRAARSSLRALIKIHKGDERRRTNNKRRRLLVGDDGDADLQRQDVLVRDMPDIISTLVLDLRSVAQRAFLYRDSKSENRMTRSFAFEMQDVIVRCTAVSFMLCHIRPSLVESAEVYLTTETRLACSRCQRADCSATSFLVHPTEDRLVFIAEHHKGNKGQASGEAIMQRSGYHWLVVLFREWVMWGHALAYTGELPPDAYVRPELRRATRCLVRRYMLMRAPKGGPQQGVYRSLNSGEATLMLRNVTGTQHQHKDYRHAFITVLRMVCLPASTREQLVEDIQQARALPDWVSASAARCLGNSLAMWRSTYDHGESPVDAETTEQVLHVVRKHLQLLCDLGLKVGDSIPDKLPDPEERLNDSEVSYSVEWGSDEEGGESDAQPTLGGSQDSDASETGKSSEYSSE